MVRDWIIVDLEFTITTLYDDDDLYQDSVRSKQKRSQGRDLILLCLSLASTHSKHRAESQPLSKAVINK